MEQENILRNIYPIKNYSDLIYVKPYVKANPSKFVNVFVGDYTTFTGRNFEDCVVNRFGFFEDKLIIGKFCSVAKGVQFSMNGSNVNHHMSYASTFPFELYDEFKNSCKKVDGSVFNKGDLVIGNDVWIGSDVKIMPGVHVGDGAIIGCSSVVTKTVEPYTIVAGNPAKVIRKRFDDELIHLLLKFKWWDKSVEEICDLVPVLLSSDVNELKKQIYSRLG